MIDPERLKASNATRLERRMLSAADSERPSLELTNRMRLAVGLSGAGTTALGATKATGLSTGSTPGLAWISAGLVAAAIVGGAVGVWTSTRRAVSASARPAAPVECVGASTLIGPPAPNQILGRNRKRIAVSALPAAGPGNLRDEIALVDEARTALREQAPQRALAVLRRYAAAYPEGTFAPEAEALRVEALNDSGQHRLAQSLARDFVRRHPTHPLAERIGRSIDERP
jgi:hypothetical protein